MSELQNSTAERIVEVTHKDGLHMRPAMQFVDCANGFESKINVYKEKQCVDGKSIMQMTMLAATKGTALRIVAEGHDAHEAVDSLSKVLKNQTTDE